MICADIFQSIDTFVDEVHWEETDGAKCDKVRALKLDNDEWQRVSLFLGLLAVCVSYRFKFLMCQCGDTLPACRQRAASIFI